MRQAVFDPGTKWANNPERPRISRQILAAWRQLIAGWVDRNLPLLVRKARNNRGACIVGADGRRLVATDNSPAQWAFAFAHSGRCLRVHEVISLLERGELPVAIILKTNERARAVY